MDTRLQYVEDEDEDEDEEENESEKENEEMECARSLLQYCILERWDGRRGRVLRRDELNARSVQSHSSSVNNMLIC